METGSDWTFNSNPDIPIKERAILENEIEKVIANLKAARENVNCKCANGVKSLHYVKTKTIMLHFVIELANPNGTMKDFLRDYGDVFNMAWIRIITG